MPSFKNHSTDASARYVYGIQSGRFIKIGVATSIAKRLHVMRLSNPHSLAVVFKRKIQAAFYFERKMHELLADKAIGREWFDVSVDEMMKAAEVAGEYAKDIRSLALKNLKPRKIDTQLTQPEIKNSEKITKRGT